MSIKKKRHGGEAVASERPEKLLNPCEVHHQIAAAAIRAALAGFPPAIWKRSAEWNLDQARTAKSIAAQKHHLRRWVVRWGCYMRSIRGGFGEYAPLVVNSAALSSGLPVRYRAASVRKLCREIDRIVWGED